MQCCCCSPSYTEVRNTHKCTDITPTMSSLTSSRYWPDASLLLCNWNINQSISLLRLYNGSDVHAENRVKHHHQPYIHPCPQTLEWAEYDRRQGPLALIEVMGRTKGSGGNWVRRERTISEHTSWEKMTQSHFIHTHAHMHILDTQCLN